MEEQKKEIKKGWKTFWFIFDIIFFGLYFLCFLAISDLGGFLSYFEGLLGTNLIFYAFNMVFFYWPLLIVSIAIYLVVAIFRMVSWRYLVKNVRKRRYLRNAVIVYLTIFNPIFGLIIHRVSGPPRYISFTKGFKVRMQFMLDVIEIQEWLKSLDKSEFDGHYPCDLYKDGKGQFVIMPNDNSYKVLDKTEFVDSRCLCQDDKVLLVIPDTLTNTDSYKELHKNDQGDICLRLMWGGSWIGQWGVIIGPKDMQIPPSISWTPEKSGEYRLKLADGAYVWYGLQ